MKICHLSSTQHSILLGLWLSLTSSPSHKLLLCLLCSGLLTGLPSSTLEPSVVPTFLQRSQDSVAQILFFPCFTSFNDILLQLEKLSSPCEDLKWWSSPASFSLSTSQLSVLPSGRPTLPPYLKQNPAHSLESWSTTEPFYCPHSLNDHILMCCLFLCLLFVSPVKIYAHWKWK